MAATTHYVVGDDGTMTAVAEGESGDTTTQGVPDPGYDSWKKDDLEAEVSKRNEGRADDDVIVVEGNGNKPDLVAALVADDNA